MEINQWITIIASSVAIIVSAVIAVWVSQSLQTKDKKRNLRLGIFSVLMANRTDPINPAYYNSLNMIDVVFHDDYKIRQAWAAYYEALHDPTLDNESGYQFRMQKEKILFTQMANSIGLEKISEVDIGHIYIPKGALETKAKNEQMYNVFFDVFKRMQRKLEEDEQEIAEIHRFDDSDN